MNSVILTGRLTRDPDTKYCGKDNETCVSRFTLAVDRNNANNEADFIACKVIGKRAEWVEKYIHKGSRIELAGRIQTGSYENERGDKVYYTEVLANTVEFGESKREADSQPQSTNNSPNQAAEQGTSNTKQWGFMDIPEGSAEDMPFS